MNVALWVAQASAALVVFLTGAAKVRGQAKGRGPRRRKIFAKARPRAARTGTARVVQT